MLLKCCNRRLIVVSDFLEDDGAYRFVSASSLATPTRARQPKVAAQLPAGDGTVEVGELGEIAGCVVGPRLCERLIGEDLLDRLIEHIEEVLCGVSLRIGEADEVAQRVIAVIIRVIRWVRVVELDNGFELVGGVVGVLDDRAG